MPHGAGAAARPASNRIRPNRLRIKVVLSGGQLLSQSGIATVGSIKRERIGHADHPSGREHGSGTGWRKNQQGKIADGISFLPAKILGQYL